MKRLRGSWLLAALLIASLAGPAQCDEPLGSLTIHGEKMARELKARICPSVQGGEMDLKSFVAYLTHWVWAPDRVHAGPELRIDSSLDMERKASFEEQKDVPVIIHFSEAADKFDVDIIMSDKFVVIRPASKVSYSVR